MRDDFRLTTILFENFSLFYSEPVLFIDDDESETRELDRVLDERMGSEDDICFSGLESFSSIFLHPGSERSDKEIGTNSPLHEPRFIAGEVLSCEDLGWSHDGNLECAVCSVQFGTSLITDC